MSTQDTKKIGDSAVNKSVSNTDMLHNTWKVMKPFVHFSVGAMSVLAHSLVHIVKSIPKPEHHGPDEEKNKKVIKSPL